MPAPIYYAHRLMQRQSELRKDGCLPWLRPDAKSQVTIRYDAETGKAIEIDTIVISTQHHPDVSHVQLSEAVIEEIVADHADRELMKPALSGSIPTGRFVIGGPDGRLRPDRAQDHRRYLRRRSTHGGGAFSGAIRPADRWRLTPAATWRRTSLPPVCQQCQGRCRTPSAYRVRYR